MTEQSSSSDQFAFEHGKGDGSLYQDSNTDIQSMLSLSYLQGPSRNAYTQGLIEQSVSDFASITRSSIEDYAFLLSHDSRWAREKGVSVADGCYNGLTHRVDYINSHTDVDAGKMEVDNPLFKPALPELTLMELEAHFDDIHNSNTGATMTLADLQDYATRCKQSPAELQAVTYAISHFDQISQTFGRGNGITQEALRNGIRYFAALETKRDSANKTSKLEPELSFLDQKFDEIHGANPTVPGISMFELKRFQDKNCVNGTESDYGMLGSVIRNFWQISDLDPNDGSRLWYTAWIMHGNADGITRQDVTAGLDKIAHVPHIDDKFDPWIK